MAPNRDAGFKWVGGRLCLDFVNTVGGRTGDAALVVRDRLASAADLAAWAREAGVAAGRGERGATAAALRRARALREALYRIFRAVARDETAPAADLDRLSAELAAARRGQRVRQLRAGTFELGSPSGAAFPDPVLGAVAESAVELLTDAVLERLRECPGEECGWLFVDESRNGRRRWCEMSDCGNLAKVRRFRARH